MCEPDEAPGFSLVNSRLKRALRVLLRASEYAQDAAHDLWDFAVPIRQLLSMSLTRNDFRWLVCKHYADHAIEVTVAGDPDRTFRPGGELIYSKRSCFVLTDRGVRFAREILRSHRTQQSMAFSGNGLLSPVESDGRSHVSSERQTDPGELTETRRLDDEPRPRWNPDQYELRIDHVLVKRFRWQATNQATVLSAFEEDGWPERIDDPLPPLPGLDSKRRLHDTIKCLNRRQKNKLIRFRGDGTGQGIRWELVDSAD